MPNKPIAKCEGGGEAVGGKVHQGIGRMNLFANIPTGLPEELIEPLLESDSVRVERIVSHGYASSDDFWYDQDRHEWVVVLSGSAKLRFEDETVEMNPGDSSTFRRTNGIVLTGRHLMNRLCG